MKNRLQGKLKKNIGQVLIKEEVNWTSEESIEIRDAVVIPLWLTGINATLKYAKKHPNSMILQLINQREMHEIY